MACLALVPVDRMVLQVEGVWHPVEASSCGALLRASTMPMKEPRPGMYHITNGYSISSCVSLNILGDSANIFFFIYRSANGL